MKRPHLLRVEGSAQAFAPLVAAAAELGLRVGWLDLAAASEPPPGLAAAAAAGVLRAVAAGPSATVAVKPRRGPAVLDDLLREHFLGCRLVLVQDGEEPVTAPLVVAAADGRYRLEKGGTLATYDAASLAARLRRPRPWPGADSADGTG